MRALIALIAGLLATPALAQTPGGCTLSAPELSFGEYDVFDAAPTRATTRVSVDCDGRLGRIRPRIELSTGSSQTYSARTQLSGSNTLIYNLYVDPGLTQVAGDGTGGSTALFLDDDETGAAQKVDLYGAIPAHQLSPPGEYFDTLYVTIIF